MCEWARASKAKTEKESGEKNGVETWKTTNEKKNYVSVFF